MIDIRELYLIKTIDKSPYVFTPDSIFESITLPSQENYTISSLKLLEAKYKFADCVKIGFDYSLIQGREQTLGFGGYLGYFNYNLNILRKVNSYSDFAESLSMNKIVNDTYQILFKDINNIWYIVYAEFEPSDIPYVDDSIFKLELKSNEAKESIFRIDNVDLTSLEIENDLSSTPSELPLGIIMDDRFIVG